MLAQSHRLLSLPADVGQDDRGVRSRGERALAGRARARDDEQRLRGLHVSFHAVYHFGRPGMGRRNLDLARQGRRMMSSLFRAVSFPQYRPNSMLWDMRYEGWELLLVTADQFKRF